MRRTKLSPAVYKGKYLDHKRTVKNKRAIKDIEQKVAELEQDATDQLRLEYESQNTFEFLSDQIRTLRSALISISDVLVEEVDQSKKETTKIRAEIRDDLEQMKKTVKVVQKENELLRSEVDTYRSYSDGRLDDLEKKVSLISNKQPKMDREMDKVLQMLNDQQEMMGEFRNELKGEIRSIANTEMKNMKKEIQNLKIDYKKAITAVAEDLAQLAQDQKESQEGHEQELNDLRQDIDSSINKHLQDEMNQKQLLETQYSKVLNKSEKFDLDLQELYDRLNNKMAQLQLKLNGFETSQQKIDYKFDLLQNENQKKYKSMSNALNVLLDLVSGDK